MMIQLHRKDNLMMMTIKVRTVKQKNYEILNLNNEKLKTKVIELGFNIFTK
jgi:hypothetical protein